jgi:hypothetical protein
MELSKARQNPALMQLTKRSQSFGLEDKLTGIVQLLTKLGIRRQAKLGTADYLVLAEDLTRYELPDVQVAFDAIAERPRAEGETAFPDVGTLKMECRRVKVARRDSEAFTARVAEETEMRRQIANEDHAEVNADMKRLSAKFAMDAPPRNPVTAAGIDCITHCIHCNGRIPTRRAIYMMTADEIEEFLPLKREIERIAAKNQVTA